MNISNKDSDESIIDEQVNNYLLQYKLHQQKKELKELKKQYKLMETRMGNLEINGGILEEMKLKIYKAREGSAKETQVNILKRQNCVMKRSIRRLQNSLDTLYENEKTLSDLMEAYKSEAKDLQVKLDLANKELKSTEKTHLNLLETSQSSQLKAEKMAEELRETKHLLEKSEFELKNINIEVEDARAQHEVQTNHVKQLKEEHNEVQMRLEASIKELGVSRDTAFQNLRNEHQTSLELLKKDFSEKQITATNMHKTEVDKLHYELNQLQTDLDKANRTFSACSSRHQESISKIKKDYDNIAADYDDYKRSVENHKATSERQLSELQAYNQILLRDKNLIADKLYTNEKEMIKVKEDYYNHYRQELKVIQDNLRSEEQKASSLNNCLNNLKCDYESAIFELNNLKTSHESLKKNYNDYIEYKEMEIGKLKEELLINGKENYKYDPSAFDN